MVSGVVQLMASVELKKTYPAIQPDRLFQAAASALPGAGFEIWKTRPAGYLLIAHRQTQDGKIQAAISIRRGEASDITISLSGENISESTLTTSAEAFLRILQDHLA